jgi:tetratricopeptide (TPR) repeat protein
VGHLKRVLDAIRLARTLPPTPLQTFRAVEQFRLESMSGNQSVTDEYVVAAWLMSEITAGLDHQRTLYALEPPRSQVDLKVASTQVENDFRQDAVELEAWSVLYYRYVRVDLGLDWAQLSDAGHQIQRTLRRRQEHGLTRLLHHLMNRETEARQHAHLELLHAQTRPVPGTPLVGRERMEEQAWAHLTKPSGRRHVALVGPGGIGKSTLAAVLAHRAIDDLELDAAVWIEVAVDMTLADLLSHCEEALGLSAAHGTGLGSYCQSHEILVVVDEIESLAESQVAATLDLQSVCEALGDARLIVTGRQRGILGIRSLELGELSETQAQILVDRISRGNLDLDTHRWQVIWKEAGGNPLALQVATPLVARLPGAALEMAFPLAGSRDHREMLEHLYDASWAQLAPPSREIWMAAWLLPPQSIDPEMLMLAARQDLVSFSEHMQQLIQGCLLDYVVDVDRYTLHAVAQSYLTTRVRQPDYHPAIVGFGERLSAATLGSPQASAIAFRLLELCDVLELDLSSRLRLIEGAWPNLSRVGQWAKWRPVLARHVAEAQMVQHPMLGRLLRWYGISCRWLGDYHDAEHLLQEALHHSPFDRAPRDYIASLIELAVIHRSQGRLNSAVASIRTALPLAEQTKDSAAVERCMLELAQLALDKAEPRLALEQLRPLSPTARWHALASDAYLLQGEFDQALDHAQQMLDFVGQAVVPNRARAEAALGRIYLAQGHLDRAEDHLSLAVSYLKKSQDMAGWARASSALGEVYRLQNEAEQAADWLEEAAAIQRALQDRVGLVTTLESWLKLHLELADQALAAGNTSSAAELSARIRAIDQEWRQLVEALDRG